jgi:hypothetical protein
MRGYDKSLITPDSQICHSRLLDLSPPNPRFVTPDLIGGPYLPPSTAMDTRIRGYDRRGRGYDHHLSLWIRLAIHRDQQRHHEQEEMTFS